MFQIQPYLLLLGINPYLKEDSLKTAYNGILFIEFVKISPLSEIPIFYHHNVNSMKNPPNSLSKCPKADDVKTLYFKYFILGYCNNLILIFFLIYWIKV